MNANTFFMVFIITGLSIGIISSLNFASAVNSLTNDNWCSTGKVNSLGYCINGVMSSQGGIITSQTYSSQSNPLSNTRGCSTGTVNSLGYCVNGINLQGNTNASPSYSLPTTADSNAYWCSTGVITSQHLCSSSIINSEGGTLFPNSTQALSESHTYWCKPGTSESTFCKQGNSMNSQGGILATNTSTPSTSTPSTSTPSTSTPSTSTPSTYCSTGVMNSQGLCSQPLMNSQGGLPHSTNSNSTIPTPTSNMGTIIYPGSQAMTTSNAHVSIYLGASNSNNPCVTTNNCFNPNPVMVAQGAIVSWTNNDNVFHTITSSSPSNVPSGTLFDRSISPGNVVSMSFNNPGVMNYFCKIHPWLTGQIIVGTSMGSSSSQGLSSGMMNSQGPSMGSNSTNSQGGMLISPLKGNANFWTNAYGWSHPFGNTTTNSLQATMSPK